MVALVEVTAVFGGQARPPAVGVAGDVDADFHQQLSPAQALGREPAH
ncbi:hypothetical protein [Streptomyces longwoodensis]